MNNREMASVSPDTCNPGDESDKRQRQRETDQFAGASRPPTGKDALFAANRGRQRLYAYYAIPIRRNNEGPGLAEAFDAGLQESFMGSARRRRCRTPR